MTTSCPYCWSGHGCDLENDHDGDHICLFLEEGHLVYDEDGEPCSRCPRGHPNLFHYATDEPEPHDEETP